MLKIEPLLPRPTGAAVQPPLQAALPVGSVFVVEAVRDTASQQLMLLLAGRRFLLKPGGAANEVEPGSPVQVRIVRNEPEIELALVGRTSEVAAALRRELPVQANPLRLLANLQWLAQDAPDVAAALPERVRTAIDAALRTVVTREDLESPAGVERAAKNSGLRLESQLATASPRQLGTTLAADWKGALYQLQDALTEAGGAKLPAATSRVEIAVPTRHGALTAVPPETATLATIDADDVRTMLGELSQQVRESIARVACTQLASLDRADQPALPLLIEIPYRAQDGNGLLRMRIDREGAATAKQPGVASVWSLEFAVDLGVHGPLRGRVTLAEGHVSVTLQPEFMALAQAIDAHVGELRETLQDAGVPVGKLTCVRSDPVQSSPSGSWLVNLRA